MFISKKIKYFMLTAELLSFKAAADKLFLSITPVCKGVHDLEDFLGYKLFYRENQILALTKEGAILYQSLTPVIDRLKAIENVSKQTHVESIDIKVDGFYFYGINEIIKHICEVSKLPVNITYSDESSVKTDFLNNANSIMIVNSLSQEEIMHGWDFIDLGSDMLKVAIATKVYEKTQDIAKLMHEIPLVQLSTTLRHPYYSAIYKYREVNNINTRIYSMSEVPSVSVLINEGIGMSFVSGTVERGDHWKNGRVVLVDPPIENLTVYRKFYYKRDMFKNHFRTCKLMDGLATKKS